LDPNVNTRPWTPEEEATLTRVAAELGQQWSKMVPCFENRTDIAIKNHHQLMKRRERKLWTKSPPFVLKKDRDRVHKRQHRTQPLAAKMALTPAWPLLPDEGEVCLNDDSASFEDGWDTQIPVEGNTQWDDMGLPLFAIW
jgi:hypothetical protein